jgi:CDP-diacylglycerol--serine O-phosphatidyltransferase
MSKEKFQNPEHRKKKLFFGVYNPSIILTYIGVFFALFGLCCMLTFNECTDSVDAIGIAMIALAISGVCDLYDGVIARKCKRTEKEKAFGVQLDSLADTVSFVVLPAAILMFAMDGEWHAMLVVFTYAFTGIMRLGWFNITTEENGRMFHGMPVTMAGLLLPLIYFISRQLAVVNIGVVIEAACGIIAMLFISNFKFKKPSAKFAIIWTFVALFVVVALIAL